MFSRRHRPTFRIKKHTSGLAKILLGLLLFIGVAGLGVSLPAGLSNKVLSITTPYEFAFETIKEWDQFINTIRNSGAQEIDIYVKGNGGYLSLQESVIRDLKDLQRKGIKINMIVSDFAASAHASFACYGDTITFLPLTVYLVHGATNEDPKTGKERLISQEKNKEFWAECSNKKIIDLQTVQDLLAGKNIIFFIDKNGKVTKKIEDRPELK